MTTPIERAARSIHFLGCADERYGGACTHNPTNPYSREAVEAVLAFESIDQDELVSTIDRAEKATKTGSKPQRQRLIAESIIAYLLGEQP